LSSVFTRWPLYALDLCQSTASHKDVTAASKDRTQWRCQHVAQCITDPVLIYRVGQKVSCCISGCNCVNYGPI